MSPVEPESDRGRFFVNPGMLRLGLGAVVGGLVMIWFPQLTLAGLGFVFLLVVAFFSREKPQPGGIPATPKPEGPEASKEYRGSLFVVRGIAGVCLGVFVGGVFTFCLPQLLQVGVFVVPLLVAVFLESLIIGNPGKIPNTRGLVLGRLGIVAGLLLLEVVGCQVIEWARPSEGSSDFRAALGCLVFLSICIGLAAPLSAELASFWARRSQDVG